MAISSNGDYDWAAEVKKLDETKAGVKGLVDAGVAELPPLFVHPPADLLRHSLHAGKMELPTIDLAGAGGSRRREVVEEMGKAAAEWGFFRIVNHGIPVEVMEEMLEGVKRFHELPAEEKMPFYGRNDIGKAVKFNSTLPVRENDPASWRDLLACQFHDDQLDPQLVPSACRKEIMEYVKYTSEVKETMSEFLSEALGFPSDYLSKMECMKSQVLACLYYPVCPEPHKTLGNQKHSDATFLTLLLEDDNGGLQILRDDQWVDAPPVRGALIANIGNLMQIISNDKFFSMQHRVRAQQEKARVSVAAFFTPSVRVTATEVFGPIKELLSDENTAAYREVSFYEYLRHYISKGERVTSPLQHYKI